MTKSGDEEPTLLDSRVPPSLPVDMSTSTSVTESRSQGDSQTIETLMASNAVVEEQAARNRGLLRMGVVGGIFAAIALQLPKTEAPGRVPATVAMVLIAVSCLWALLAKGASEEIQSRRLFVISIGVTLSVHLCIYHVGVFSPVPMVLLFGVYFFALGDSVARSWATFLTSAVGYLVLGVCAAFGVIDIKRAMLALYGIDTRGLLALTGFLTLMFSMTFWLARLSRLATLRAMAQLEAVRRQAHQREALLNEARADLDRALQAPGAGRLTGRLLGAYRVEGVIGRGATGEVYAAQHTQEGHAVAIKALFPHVSESESACRRFMREAHICGALESPHIVRVYETGATEDKTLYLAMELLNGTDLATMLRTRRRLSKRAAVDLISQVAAALAVAQDAGVVHRDLKPQNLFCVESGAVKTWKVLDFGVSRINQSSSSLTQDAAVGTPSYMAPEQARGDKVDHRADVFALGVIAYRVLTGRPPFTGEDTFATMYNVAYRQPAKPSELAPLDMDVDLVLALALAKDRERRFSSAPSFAAALRDALRGELDGRLRRDALELLSNAPWGADLGASSQPSQRRQPAQRRKKPEARSQEL